MARILDGIAHLSFVCGPGRGLELVNPYWLDFTGLTTGQSVGEGWRCAIQSDDLARFEDRWNKVIAQGESNEIEACLRRHDGVLAAPIFHQYRWFLFCGAPLLDSTGAVPKWLGLNIDIDDRKGAEAALRRTQAALSRSRASTPPSGHARREGVA